MSYKLYISLFIYNLYLLRKIGLNCWTNLRCGWWWQFGISYFSPTNDAVILKSRTGSAVALPYRASAGHRSALIERSWSKHTYSQTDAQQGAAAAPPAALCFLLTPSKTCSGFMVKSCFLPPRAQQLWTYKSSFILSGGIRQIEERACWFTATGRGGAEI